MPVRPGEGGATPGARNIDVTPTSDGSTRERIKLIAAVVIFVAAGVMAWYSLAGPLAEDATAIRGFLCNECQHAFDYKLKEGDRDPLRCPKCKAMAGYLAERCYWTKGPDGEWKAKLRPTYVILKTRINPDSDERTYCPDCGREVVGHNPMPPDELMAQAE
jgi:hypothetical protein